MAKKKQESKTYMIRYFCDKCGSGEMIPEGKPRIENDNVIYRHKCNNKDCEYMMDFNIYYPHTITESYGPMYNV